MLSLILSLAAAAAVTLCAAVAIQLHSDQQARPAPRHCGLTVPPATPPTLPPPPAPEPEQPAVFDPLDARTTLEEVERFLDSLAAADALAAANGPTGELETIQ